MRGVEARLAVEGHEHQPESVGRGHEHACRDAEVGEQGARGGRLADGADDRVLGVET